MAEKVVIFVCKYPEQVYSVNGKNDHRRVDEFGNQHTVKGKYASFIAHILKTSDPETIEFLRSHRDYGNDELSVIRETESINASEFEGKGPHVRVGVAGADNKASVKSPEESKPESRLVKIPRR